jgi:cytochrome c oxidase subunit 2
MWLKATETGTYSGQCAEFCGIGHAQMRMTVIVETQEDFDAWLQQQAAAQKGGQPALVLQGD